MRAAAAITSITMNGGTSLRPEAVNRPFACSLSIASSIDLCYFTGCPRLALFGGLVGHIRYQTRRQSFHLKTADAAPLSATWENKEAHRRRYRGRARSCANSSPGAAGGPRDPPRHRDRAALARLYTADPAGRRPGEAEYPGDDHQSGG